MPSAGRPHRLWSCDEHEDDVPGAILKQGIRFAVAFGDCLEMCTHAAFAYVWPMELNPANVPCPSRCQSNIR